MSRSFIALISFVAGLGGCYQPTSASLASSSDAPAAGAICPIRSYKITGQSLSLRLPAGSSLRPTLEYKASRCNDCLDQVTVVSSEACPAQDSVGDDVVVELDIKEPARVLVINPVR